MNKVDVLIQEVEAIFRDYGNAEFAESMHNYVRQQFDFYGIKMTPRRIMLKSFFAQTKQLSHDDLLELAKKMYERSEREFHHTAIEVLDKQLKPKDLIESDIQFFEWLIGQHSWWDTIDVIAPRLVRDYFYAFPHQRDKIVDRWLTSGDRWLVRSAILFQLKMKEDVDFPYLFEVIKRATGTSEFFINKAIGWILREHGKRHPDRIREFIRANEEILHPLSIREGMRKLL